MARALLDGSGQMCGPLIILEVTNMAEATTWATNGPYSQKNLFESTKIVKWKRLLVKQNQLAQN